jgi:hypothetical protein
LVHSLTLCSAALPFLCVPLRCAQRQTQTLYYAIYLINITNLLHKIIHTFLTWIVFPNEFR